jgi:hypothetical protein
MNLRLIPILIAATAAAACAGSVPEPKQPLADAESAARSARELGADTQPAAKLEVSLADEQIVKAKALIASGDNGRATYVVLRARADAELAIALAREQHASTEVQKTVTLTAATLNTNTAGATP